VRGFPASARRGTRAWRASAELRLPLALLTSRPRPLPLYLDRLSLAAFADAGDASCATDEACDPTRLGPALLGAGCELWLETSLLGFEVLLRAGGAAPVRGSDSHAPRWYLQVGAPF
jgi:hemolysin activation/secretion protein